MFELLDIAGAYKSKTNHLIVEKYYDIEKKEIFYTIYINNTNEDIQEDIHTIPVQREVSIYEESGSDEVIHIIPVQREESIYEESGSDEDIHIIPVQREESEIEEDEESEEESEIEEDEESEEESGSEEDEEIENNNVIEYKWNNNNSIDINNLLIFLKTEGGSYYDENNEILYGPDIKNISRDVSYEITSYEKGFRNKYHNFCFDEIPLADKDLSLILNENYGTIII